MKYENLKEKHFSEMLSHVGLLIPDVPEGGWLKAVRKTLGMTMEKAAGRIGAKASSWNDAEKREVSGTISMLYLRKAAEAIGCELRYVLVPKVPLDQMIRKQAELKADEVINSNLDTMKLELQAPGADHMDERRTSLIYELLSENIKNLW